MKSLAELKRTIKPGTRILCLSHWRDAPGRHTNPNYVHVPLAGVVRFVQKTQGNGYWYFAERNGVRDIKRS